MTVDYVTEFKDSTPTSELILQKLRENTGLYILLDEKKNILFHTIVNEMVHFYIEDNKVIILLGHLKMFYLLGATLGALEDLGGTSDCDIPAWTRKKWQGKSLFRLLWK